MIKPDLNKPHVENPHERKNNRENINPFFFNNIDKVLLGCFHKPSEDTKRKCAVLLCYPTGHEYERCHRAFRQLATQLALSGFPAMRFDYFGSGDSAGDYNDATIDQWQSDIKCALEICKKQSGCEQVAIIGLRLGATLAMLALEGYLNPGPLILWNPITDGAHLIDEWTEEQHEHELQARYQPGGPAIQEVLGMPFTKMMRDGLKKLDITNCSPPKCPALVASHDMSPAVTSLISYLRRHGANADIKNTKGVTIWRQEPMNAVVPLQVLRSFVDWLKVNTL